MTPAIKVPVPFSARLPIFRTNAGDSRELLNYFVKVQYSCHAKLSNLSLSCVSNVQNSDLQWRGKPGFTRMLRWAVHKVCVGTALRRRRDPGLRTPLGRGAGLILIAGCEGRPSAILSKNAWRFG